MSGRTTWWSKDAGWWRRARVVEVGQAHGPAGPAVLDWLTCEAKSQGPTRGHDGSVKSGYAAVSYGCFLPTGDDVKAVLATLVEVGLLENFDDKGRTFTCRISGWEQDVEQPLAATRKAAQRASKNDPDSSGTTGDNGGQEGMKSPDVPLQDKTEQNYTPLSGKPDVAAAWPDLFDYWRRVCKHPTAKPTSDRRTKVVARLRDGYSPEQIKRAIDGAAIAPYVDRGRRYDDLELICRTGSKLEGFIERAPGRPRLSAVPDGQTAPYEGRTAPDGRPIDERKVGRLLRLTEDELADSDRRYLAAAGHLQPQGAPAA